MMIHSAHKSGPAASALNIPFRHCRRRRRMRGKRVHSLIWRNTHICIHTIRVPEWAFPICMCIPSSECCVLRAHSECANQAMHLRLCSVCLPTFRRCATTPHLLRSHKCETLASAAILQHAASSPRHVLKKKKRVCVCEQKEVDPFPVHGRILHCHRCRATRR